MADTPTVQSNPFDSTQYGGQPAAPRTSVFDSTKYGGQPIDPMTYGQEHAGETPATTLETPTSKKLDQGRKGQQAIAAEAPSTSDTAKEIFGTMNNAISQGLGHDWGEMWENIKKKAPHLADHDPITGITNFVQEKLDESQEAESKYSPDTDLGKRALASVPVVGPAAAETVGDVESGHLADAAKNIGSGILQGVSGEALGKVAGAATDAAAESLAPAEGTRIYHSTASPAVNSVADLDAAKSNHYATAGPGTYFTTDPAVAKQYTKSKPNAKLHEGVLHPDTQLLDGHAELPENVQSALKQAGIEGKTYFEALQDIRESGENVSSRIKAVQAAIAREGYHGVSNIYPDRDVLALFGNDVMPEGSAQYSDLVKPQQSVASKVFDATKYGGQQIQKAIEWPLIKNQPELGAFDFSGSQTERIPYKEGLTLPPERTTGTPEIDAAIKQGGGIPAGVMQGDPSINLPGLTLFHDPTTGSTLALKGEITPDAVKKKLRASRDEYLKANPNEYRDVPVSKNYKPSEKAATMSGERKNYGPEFDAAQQQHEIDRYKDILRNPKATENDIRIAKDRLNELQHPDLTKPRSPTI